MSDEFCAGVQILLKRMESNPDEFKDRGKWEMLTRAVFAHKEGNFAEAWTVRSLTHAEIDALHAGCVKIYRPAFDEYVMKNVLNESEARGNDSISAEQAWQMSRGKQIIGAWTDPRGTISVTAGGSGGSGQVQVQIKPESVMSKLKRELGL
jgi:hypothetical protein